MANPPNLLNDDGSASMATALMMSHHAFRRDLALFARALEREPELARADALREAWQGYRGALHGHHTKEDGDIFPALVQAHAELGPVIARLSADHQRIDPLLARGDDAFADLRSKRAEAASVIAEIKALLWDHLTTEEATIVGFLRDAHEFPAPANELEVGMYADGFAWSMDGVAPAVIDRVHAILPEVVVARLPAARAKFEARCVQVWGAATGGASTTPVPDWLR